MLPVASEALLRRELAARLPFSGRTWIQLGLLTQSQWRLAVERRPGSPLLAEQCHWVRFGRERGEIDIVLRLPGVAIECKAKGTRPRLNWEEALGQALRDLHLPWVHAAFVAVQSWEVAPWMLETIIANCVGVITLDGNSTAPLKIIHPQLLHVGPRVIR